MATDEKGLVKQEEKQGALAANTSSWVPDWKLATIIAKSGLAPKGYGGKPEDTFVAIQMGREIGLKPLQAVQNIAVINGRPCVWGDAALALVQNAEDFEWVVENEPKGSADADFAECIVKRKGRPEIRRTFSWGDAKRARLLQKEGTWQTYPKRMLQMRARGFCLRDAAADILKGLAIREEVEDYEVSVEQGGPAADIMPKRASEAPTEPPAPEATAAPEQPTNTPPPPDESPLDAPPPAAPPPRGNTAAGAPRNLSDAQIKRLFAIGKSKGYDSKQIKEYVAGLFGCEIEDLSRADYDQVCGELEAMQ